MTFEEKKEFFDKIIDESKKIHTKYLKDLDLIESIKDVCKKFDIEIDTTKFVAVSNEYDLVKFIVYQYNNILIDQLFTKEEIEILKKIFEGKTKTTNTYLTHT